MEQLQLRFLPDKLLVLAQHTQMESNKSQPHTVFTLAVVGCSMQLLTCVTVSWSPNKCVQSSVKALHTVQERCIAALLLHVMSVKLWICNATIAGALL